MARNAKLAVRYRKVTLPPTKDKTAKPVRVWGIHVREVAPPRNAEAIEWYLLTTAEVSSLAEAEEIIKFYCLRWRVEDMFRVLKTGCKVEQLQMQQANRLHLVNSVCQKKPNFGIPRVRRPAFGWIWRAF